MKNLQSIKNIEKKDNTFDYKDPFLLEEQLTEEEILIRNTTRDFAQKELQPQI